MVRMETVGRYAKTFSEMPLVWPTSTKEASPKVVTPKMFLYRLPLAGGVDAKVSLLSPLWPKRCSLSHSTTFLPTRRRVHTIFTAQQTKNNASSSINQHPWPFVSKMCLASDFLLQSLSVTWWDTSHGSNQRIHFQLSFSADRSQASVTSRIHWVQRTAPAVIQHNNWSFYLLFPCWPSSKLIPPRVYALAIQIVNMWNNQKDVCVNLYNALWITGLQS